MTDKKETAEERIKRKNKELIDRMRAGESLSQFSKEESFFPKRGKIEKDKSLVDKLFGEDDGDK